MQGRGGRERSTAPRSVELALVRLWEVPCSPRGGAGGPASGRARARRPPVLSTPEHEILRENWCPVLTPLLRSESGSQNYRPWRTEEPGDPSLETEALPGSGRPQNSGGPCTPGPPRPLSCTHWPVAASLVFTGRAIATASPFIYFFNVS